MAASKATVKGYEYKWVDKDGQAIETPKVSGFVKVEIPWDKDGTETYTVTFRFKDEQGTNALAGLVLGNSWVVGVRDKCRASTTTRKDREQWFRDNSTIDPFAKSVRGSVAPERQAVIGFLKMNGKSDEQIKVILGDEEKYGKLVSKIKGLTLDE